VTPFLSQPLDPARGGGFNAVQFGVGETLMRLDESFTPVPWLAADLTAVDPLTWQISLREGATFHDGAPVDAAAVQAALERAISENPTAATLLNVDSFTVIDPRTLHLKTLEANPRMPGLLTEPSTVIVHAAAAATLGADAFAQQPIMTGSFKVEQFAQDREVVLVRHDGYWGTPARSAQVVITVQADANARMLALQSGQVDIAIDIRPESVQVAERDANLRVVRAAPVATMFLYLNQRKPVWQDVRVRQALAYAMPPREALVQTVLRGEGVPGVGPIPPTVLPCDNLNGYTQDLERARALLAEAGFSDADGDGIVERDGEPLRMLVLSYPQRPALTPMAEIIQANLQAIGIAMEIQSVEQINEALANQDWDGGMYFNNMAATGDPYGSLVQFYTAEGASNRGSYQNADVEAAIQALQPIPERAERLERACAISQQLLDDVAIIPLVYPNYNYGVAAGVVGFDTAHPYFLYFLNSALGR
jgi:peptide/nickel transport system substrate-binding protein